PWLRPLPPRSDPPRRPRALPSFPTRRSSDLTGGGAADILQTQSMAEVYRIGITRMLSTNAQLDVRPCTASVFDSKFHQLAYADLDRKSTRLNSSHVKISYAVFCLKTNRHATL